MIALETKESIPFGRWRHFFKELTTSLEESMIPGLAEGKEPRPPCEGTRVKEGGATESRRSSINNLIIARRAIRAPINYHPCSSGVNPTVSLPSSAAPTLSITPQGGRLYRGTAPSPRRPGGALPFHRANLNDPFHKRLFTLQCGHFLISGFRYRTNCFCAKENTKESSMEFSQNFVTKCM